MREQRNRRNSMYTFCQEVLADYVDEIANFYRFSVLQATESWAGPGNEASTEGWDNARIHFALN